MTDRITFRLGPLAGPMADYCKKRGCTASEAIRTAVARLLQVEAPAMPQGNPGIAEQAAAGAAARWKAKRKNRTIERRECRKLPEAANPANFD